MQKPDDIALGIVEIVVADPGKRQIGEHAVIFVQPSNATVSRAALTALAAFSITPFERPVVPDV